ncbi:MAG: hypothetical protein H6Q76_2469 [Firmicutes bacterium]|nr:hypothetical protein [Bacillota bacterium]
MLNDLEKRQMAKEKIDNLFITRPLVALELTEIILSAPAADDRGAKNVVSIFSNDKAWRKWVDLRFRAE